MDTSEIISLITQSGFAAFVAVYLLVELKKALKSLESEINALNVSIVQLQDEFKHHEVSNNDK